MGTLGRHLPEKDIIEITKNCFNTHKTFGDLGLTSNSHKGGLGNFVEKKIFGIEPNTDPHPDFIDAGIELKVTPLKDNGSETLVSKERLVLNMIDYFKEENATFETSSFYKKNKRLLIWFYRYTRGKPQSSFNLEAWDLFEFEHSVEYKVIKRDWEIIHNKIKSGKAHEISESDTMFLAACTKGVDSSKTRSQPHTDIKAKPRAYSFKNSFMTRLYRELIHKLAPYVSFISEDEWIKNPLEEIYKEKLAKYKGKSINELKTRFKLGNPKDLTFRIAQRMLGLTGNETSTLEMLDAGIKLKTVRINGKGVPYESMSFPAFDFTELINTKWEESNIREDFVDWKLMFFVFKDDKNGMSRFDRVQFWNIPNKIVDKEIKYMYVEAAELIRTGNALEYKDGKLIDNFAKEKRNSNGICHIRPHGRRRNDMFDLPVKDKRTGLTRYTKQSFWFNKKFIEKVLKEGNEELNDW